MSEGMRAQKRLLCLVLFAACFLLSGWGVSTAQARATPGRMGLSDTLPVNADALTPPATWVRGFILTAAATVRRDPDPSSPALGNLRGGEGVQVVGRTASGEWLQIIYPPDGGGRGWLRASQVETFGMALGLPLVADGAQQAVTPAPQAATPQARAPALSGKLALQTASGGEIYLVHADGSGLRRLTDGLDPALSPDGRFVAFARWREPMGLYVLDLATGEERRLFAGNRVRTPAWSPDGASVMFSHEVGGRPAQEVCFPVIGCFRIPAETFRRLGQVRLADGKFQDVPSDLHSISPTWSPTGERFAYRGDRGIRLATLEGEASWLLPDVGAMGPAWSPVGERLAIQLRRHDHWDIFLLNTTDGSLTPLTGSSPLAGRAANNVAPVWSPDGTRIAFFTDRNGRWELYVMNADGSEQRPLFPRGLPGITFRYDFAAERMVSWSR